MASSWTSLAAQLTKVKIAYTNLAPPEPDDEFEVVRKEADKQMSKVIDYVQGRMEQDE